MVPQQRHTANAIHQKAVPDPFGFERVVASCLQMVAVENRGRGGFQENFMVHETNL